MLEGVSSVELVKRSQSLVRLFSALQRRKAKDLRPSTSIWDVKSICSVQTRTQKALAQVVEEVALVVAALAAVLMHGLEACQV